MTKPALKIGDVVKVYDGSSERIGKIAKIAPISGLIGVEFPSGDSNIFNPKQLRRLRPRKPKAEVKPELPRIAPGPIKVRLMVHFNGREYGELRVYSPEDKPLSMLPGIASARFVELSEIPSGSKVVSRSDLEKAVRAYENDHSSVGNAYEALCKSLGFGSEGK